MSTASPRVLVTGATGFVGLRLCAQLASEGYALKAAVRQESASLLSFLPAASIVRVSEIGPCTDWKSALAGVDVVVHLAARAHVMRDCSADPLAEYRRINVSGTECLARAAVISGVSRLVYMSSIKVNGEATSNMPFRESDAPAPLDAYGLSKWEAEQALGRIGAETGLNVTILRPPLVYGPGVKGNLARLLAWIERGWLLPLASVANQRSLIYLDNLISAVLAVLRNPGSAKTYLVSDVRDLSTPQLILALAKGLGTPARLLPFPPGLLRLAGAVSGRLDTIERLTGSLQVDASKIRTELGWHPPHDPEEGLILTSTAYRLRH